MKEMVRYGFILAVICIIASGLLAAVNSLTQPRIIAQAQAEENSTLLELLPGASSFTPVKSAGEVLYYKGYDKNKKFLGAVFKASAKGYSSVIETMAGMTRDGKITAIKIVNQNETPGLGSRVAEPDFISRFSAKDVRELSRVQAITGATISSTAVINSVANKARDIEELIRNEK
jgi:electron transport complex protein RnfG